MTAPFLSLWSQVQTYSIHMVVSSTFFSYFISITKLHPEKNISRRTTALWIRLQAECFPDHYNLDLYMSRDNYHLFYLKRRTIFLAFTYDHISSNSNVLTWVALTPCIGFLFHKAVSLETLQNPSNIPHVFADAKQ